MAGDVLDVMCITLRFGGVEWSSLKAVQRENDDEAYRQPLDTRVANVMRYSWKHHRLELRSGDLFDASYTLTTT